MISSSLSRTSHQHIKVASLVFLFQPWSKGWNPLLLSVNPRAISKLSILSNHVEYQDLLQSLPLKWSIILPLPFLFYALFSWEASCYESFLVSHDVSIYCMLDLSYPLWTSLQVLIPHPRHHSSWIGTLLPFLLGYFFIARRLCINDVVQQCHITTLCLRPLLSLKVWSYYSSSWIIYRIVITCSSEQVSSFFSCMRLYMIFPTIKIH